VEFTVVTLDRRGHAKLCVGGDARHQRNVDGLTIRVQAGARVCVRVWGVGVGGG
jgi:hypothetical protein